MDIKKKKKGYIYTENLILLYYFFLQLQLTKKYLDPAIEPNEICFTRPFRFGNLVNVKKSVDFGEKTKKKKFGTVVQYEMV